MASLKNIVYPILSLLILIVSLRGMAGAPTPSEFASSGWKEEGPFELSPERGRFALIYSLAEDKSFHFSVPVARFVTPDLGYWNGNYVSLLAPGVSLMVLPGYLIGKSVGMSQVGSFGVISLFAVANLVLIRKIAIILGANTKAAIVAGMLFLFATPAYAYSVNLYQHHISTFLILFGIYIVADEKVSWRKLLVLWFLTGLSIMVDNPNLFLMFPVGASALSALVDVRTRLRKIRVIFRPGLMLTFVGGVIPLVIFGLVNYFSYGSPMQLAGTVPYVAAIGSDGKPYFPEESEFTLEDLQNAGSQSSVGFFNPRNLVNGLYIHLVGPDRGVVVFSPVILLGVLGAYVLYRNKSRHLPVLLSVVLVDVTLYSMWGDPWGGWAFGSRYLIPAYAVMAIFISVALTKFKKSRLLMMIFSLLLFYSIAVNTLGAITTSANPPKVQALPLEQITGKQERYSFDRNWEYLNSNGSKSFFFKEFVSELVDARTYYFVLVGTISAMSFLPLMLFYSGKEKK